MVVLCTLLSPFHATCVVFLPFSGAHAPCPPSPLLARLSTAHADPVVSPLSPKGAPSPKEAQPTEIVTGFTGRVQELTTIGSRVALTGLLLPEEARKFELELRNYHRLDASEVAAHLGSDAAKGLAPAAAAARIAKDGKNVLAPPKPRPLLLRLFLSFFGGFAPVSGGGWGRAAWLR
jgi:hypothetical protein